ncbi:cytochrome c oxidase subunit III [Anaeromyxobacter sp. K]|uniref:Cytochrome c oxidase subunit III n=1 Tax=Anaeromyxobacter dehalogenans (strain ATCC BAA-258 / DSM 21875 / 2CP-1) TaxID=455488 RepID=B8JDW4_ANAD2|nr:MULTISPECIES: cytochrome c oxidase subunit 3 family protein [Anaeromyxobacter]ACG72089.1 cytochrome c oxidase subunit III [Anaeromyxobacter sp. K]ACL64209.1 cytochrome c oxidase subunit III [Anaeromyxobacter dehalogenans 2CP-1]
MQASPLAHHFENIEKQSHAERLGMWLFLASEVLLFTALFAAYAVYRYLYSDAFAEASRAIETWLGLVNTIILVTSSFTVALGLNEAVKGNGKKTGLWFAVSVAFAVAFLALKAVEYSHHFHEGQLPGRYYSFQELQAPGASLFFALYFLITGLHGVHVIVGMTILAVVGVKAARGKYTAAYHTPVELAGLYWHLVDLIWIFVFPLIYLV